MMYAVSFDRIGRRGAMTQELEANSADELAEAVFRFAKRFLASRNFDVYVEFDDETGGDGHIEAGRFGTFTFEAVPQEEGAIE